MLRSLRARRKRPLSASVTTPSPARLKVSKKENKVIILPITCPVYLWSRKNVCTYPLLLNLAWIDSVQQSKEEKSASPKKRLGLKNLGNTCFMNSVSIRYPIIYDWNLRCFKVFQTLRSSAKSSKHCQVLMKDRWAAQFQFVSCQQNKSQAKKNKERRKSGGQNGALGLDGIILTDELKKVTFTIQGHNDVKLLFSRW